MQQPAAAAQQNPMYAQVRADVVQRARNYLSKVPGAIRGKMGPARPSKLPAYLVRFGLPMKKR